MSGTVTVPAAKIALHGRPAWLTTRRLVVAGAVLLLLLALAAAALLRARMQSAPSYVTVPLARADLAQTVTASGTVNPQDTVSVGTQVSGTLQTLYVDFNSRVHTGQVLARIDPSQFQAQLNQAEAGLAQVRAQAAAAGQSATGAGFSVSAASATLEAAKADVLRAQAALTLARQTLARDKSLLSRGFIAQSQYDADASSEIAAEMALRSAQATVAQNTAQRFQTSAAALGSASTAQGADAAILAAQAVVEQDRLNLDRTTITSPVDGTVVARNVSVGQTVAASFQTPTLFTIAQDLKKMEVDIAVGEPDIGNVRRGDGVDFSVLAYPNRVFHGVVSQVRVNPATVANVVTYTVIVLVDNSNNALLPGMTANTTITVAKVKNALVVPVQALSYRPPAGTRKGHSTRPGAASPWGMTASNVAGAVVSGGTGVVFVLKDGAVHGARVRIDLVGGMQAAITPIGGSIKAGDAIVVSDGSSAGSQRSSGSTSPVGGFGRGVVR